MRFMMMVKSSESDGPPPQALIEAIGKLGMEASQAGLMVDSGGLRPTSNGFRARISKGKLSIVDGPFSEAKEVIGGYAIYELPSNAEALKWAKRFMDLHLKHWPDWEGESEVRPMYGPNDFPGS